MGESGFSEQLQILDRDLANAQNNLREVETIRNDHVYNSVIASGPLEKTLQAEYDNLLSKNNLKLDYFGYRKLLNKFRERLELEFSFCEIISTLEEKKIFISKLIDVIPGEAGCWEKSFLRKLISQKEFLRRVFDDEELKSLLDYTLSRLDFCCGSEVCIFGFEELVSNNPLEILDGIIEKKEGYRASSKVFTLSTVVGGVITLTPTVIFGLAMLVLATPLTQVGFLISAVLLGLFAIEEVSRKIYSRCRYKAAKSFLDGRIDRMRPLMDKAREKDSFIRLE